jgi:putative FmdB family regulatory protein
MPIYEYRCRKCEHTFEHLAKRFADPAPDCPKCGASRPAKQLSVFSAVGSPAGDLPCGAGACAAGGCGDGACASGGCPYSES